MARKTNDIRDASIIFDVVSHRPFTDRDIKKIRDYDGCDILDLLAPDHIRIMSASSCYYSTKDGPRIAAENAERELKNFLNRTFGSRLGCIIRKRKIFAA